MKRKAKVIASLIVVAFLFCASAFAGELLFPMDAPKILTAVFGEYRINHPHGGLDFGTQGEIGTPVIAAASGRIIRLRASPFGYGRSVYVAHPDGTVTVYAHLCEFAPKIDALARKIQKGRGLYGFDKHYSGDGPALKAGEILGYAGMTGTDVPHLHFEVRRGGLPVNPLKNGIKLIDSISPKIEKLYVKPMAADARAEGFFDASFFNFHENDRIDKPIRISGQVELAAQIVDHIDGSPRSLAPYEVIFMVDGKRVHSLRLDSFNYADKTISELVYNYGYKERGLGTFIRLNRRSIRTVFHPDNLSGDLRGLSEGDHPAQIIAYDAAGNAGHGYFTLRVEPPATRWPPLRSVKNEHIEIPTPSFSLRGHVLRLKATKQIFSKGIRAADFQTKPAMAKTSVVTAAETRDGIGEFLVDLPPGFRGDAILTIKTSGNVYRAKTKILLADGGKIIASADGKAKVKFPAGSVFESFPVMASVSDAPPDPVLLPVSRLYTFNRPWEPIRRKLSVSIDMPKGTKDRDRVGLYLYDRGKYWRLGRQAAKATHLGSFALMKDMSAPVIGEAYVEKLRGRQILIISWEEAGSGVPGEGAQLWIDGRRVIAELMPVVGKLRYIPANPFSPGAHVGRLRIVDRAGNSSDGEFSFVIN